MGTFSGQYGTIDAVTDILDWTVTEESTPVESISSATQGGRRRSSGVLNSTGSFNGKGGLPPVKPFEVFAFKGYSAPDSGVYGGVGVTMEGDIYAASIGVTLNFAGNEDVAYSIDMQFDQAMTIGSAAYLDPGPPISASICPCKIEFGDEGSEAEITDITTATLTFSIDMLEYINSSTDCTTGRLPGPIDWSLDITVQNNVRQIPIQSDERLKVWINETQFFILEFGHLSTYSDFSVNPSSGEIISQTMNWMMQAYKQSDLSTIGQIIWPDLSVVWPPAAPTVVATVSGKNDNPVSAL